MSCCSLGVYLFEARFPMAARVCALPVYHVWSGSPTWLRARGGRLMLTQSISPPQLRTNAVLPSVGVHLRLPIFVKRLQINLFSAVCDISAHDCHQTLHEMLVNNQGRVQSSYDHCPHVGVSTYGRRNDVADCSSTASFSLGRAKKGPQLKEQDHSREFTSVGAQEWRPKQSPVRSHQTSKNAQRWYDYSE